MIQIIGLRPVLDKKTGKETKKHQLFLQGSTVPELFKNIKNTLSQIPNNEHWNLYYTALDCKDPKFGLRRFESQKVIPFDIDGIDITKTKEYINIVLKELELDYDKTGIVFTGNGLQLIIELSKAFTDPKFFNEKRTHYKSICNKLNTAFAKHGLPGNADSAVWSAARLLRMPNTENRKPLPKGTTQAVLIQGNIKPQDFSLDAASGIPDLDDSHHMVDWSPKNQPDIDKTEIFKTCEFIKWCQSDPEKVREPHFYAAASLLARMENGEQLCHKLAEAVRESGNDSSVGSFSHSEIENKIDQALKISGPRTCSGIDALWGGCKKCVHWQKLSSPIQIKGKDFIATLGTAFHKPIKMANGHVKMVPDYQDLRKYFDSLYFHKTNPGGIVYLYKDHHYKSTERNKIKCFALEQFNPEGKNYPFANSAVRREFLELVEQSGIVETDFFIERGKLNFDNGVLDIKTLKLMKHSPTFGFQYVLDYEYDPKADCPNFDAFLKQITCDDADLEIILLEYMGYALSGDSCWAQKCLLLSGEGANGKSTFIKLLMELAGKKNVSALSLKSMDKAVSVSMLEDKLFNISEETPTGRYIESNEVKNLITGGEVEARKLYKDPYFMENKAKLIFACNELPRASDTTGGYFRRFIIIPFKAEFEESYDPGNKRYIANKHILDELLPERSGILNRIIKAYQGMMKRQRFTKAKSSDAEIADYKVENDAVRFWALSSGRLDINPLNGGQTYPTMRDLFMSYCLCLELEAKEFPISFHRFCKKLRKIIPDCDKRYSVKKVSGKAQRVMLDVEVQELV